MCIGLPREWYKTFMNSGLVLDNANSERNWILEKSIDDYRLDILHDTNGVRNRGLKTNAKK